MKKYLDATPESGKEFYQAFHDKGKVVMLNLLKFRVEADYKGLEALNPGKSLSGSEAYQLYMQATLPILRKYEGKVVFYGQSQHFLIGPEDEGWDTVFLVEHQSVAKFMDFAQDKDYLKTAGHRRAALEDSRLLPIKEGQ